MLSEAAVAAAVEATATSYGGMAAKAAGTARAPLERGLLCGAGVLDIA